LTCIMLHHLVIFSICELDSKRESLKNTVIHVRALPSLLRYALDIRNFPALALMQLHKQDQFLDQAQ